MKNFLVLIVFLVLPIFVLAADMVDINTASLAQLDTLTGIGPVYAQRIIDGRPYSSIDDLDKVKGIGPATLQKIKDQGLACVNCAAGSNNLNNSPADELFVYPSGIFINEVLPNPEGADETEEWIELYNSNSFDVDLSGWQLQDTTGTPKTYTVSQNTNILAYGFLVLKRPETKIMLNNDGDQINLLAPDGKIIDSVSFTSAPLGQSYSKNGSWAWNTTLTPGTKNVTTNLTGSRISASARDANAAEISLPVLPKAEKFDNNIGSVQANISGARTNPWFLFFTALVTTLILATLTLIIKLKFSKNERT